MRARWPWFGQGGTVLVAMATFGMATFGGCGSDPSTMSEAVAIELGEQVQQVRAAATAGDVDDARARLAEIDTAVEAHRATGEISEDDATRITAATSDVGRSLALLTTSTSTPAATAPPPGRTDDPPVDAPNHDDEDDDDDDGDDAEKDGKNDDPPKGPKEQGNRGRGQG